MSKHFQSKDSQSGATGRRAAAMDVQAKLKVGAPGDRYEREADRTAETVVEGKGEGHVRKVGKKTGSQGAISIATRVSPLEKDFGQKKEAPAGKMEEMAQSKHLLPEKKEKEKIQKQEEEEVQAKVQRQGEEEEEEAQAKVQRQEKEEEEEEVQAKPAVPKEEEETQAKVQKQEEEEEAQTKVQEKSGKKETQTKVQRQENEEEEEEVQAKGQDHREMESPSEVQKQAEEEEEEMQAKAEPRANVRDKRRYPVINQVEPRLIASKGKGEAMDADLRTDMEVRFGADFSRVRIHTGGDAVRMAQDMHAQAFTSGADIYFNEGKYGPESLAGRLLLAHELTHVIQQGEAEAKISEAAIAENNAQRANPGPQPPDVEARQAEENTEAAIAEKKAEQPEKPEEVELSLYEGKDLKAVPEAEKAVEEGAKTGAGKGKGKGRTDEEKKKKDKEKEKTTEVGEYLKKSTEAKVKQKESQLKKLARNEKKKDDAGTKLAQTEKAVVPPAEEGQSKAKASQVETVDKVEAPKPDEAKAKEDLSKALEASLPANLEEADSFKEEGKGRIVGEKVRNTVTADTQEVQSTYQEIENTPDPEPAETPEALPPKEEAPPTPPIDLGEDVVGEVQPEHTDMSEFENESDQQLEKEGISEEQLEMVDSGPLAEAKKERKGVKEQVKKAPEEVQEVEKKEKEKVSTELKKEEGEGRQQMRQKRQKELKNTQEKQKKTKSALEQKRQAVTDHINGIYERTNTQVKQKLEDLEKRSLKAFDDGQARATKVFEDNVKRRLDAFKDDRYSGWFGWSRWLKDKLLGMDDLPGVKRIFDTEKADFIRTIDRLIADITAENKRVIQECKDMVQKAREEIATYVKNLGPELRKVGQEAQANMQAKLDSLDQEVNKKEEELKKKLEEKREAAIKAIEEKIEKMKEALKGALAKLAGLLLAALVKFFKWAIEKIGGSSDKIMGIIDKGKKVIQAIVKSPGKFLSNLGKAVSEGFARFRDNFKQHLIGGIVEWLTGAMGGVGIRIPEKFDLKGVIDLGLQVMNLTWEALRKRITRYIPEKIIAAAEKGLDIILQIREKGLIVLWDMLKEKAQEFKEGVIESIKSWAVVQMVKGAIIKLATMLNPAGAILQIALTIYDAVMWFIENKDRIIDFIMSIFSSIGEIALGMIAKAASFIEKALARIIPILLSFLARWLKLSGVANALKKAIAKVRKPIDRVVDKILKFIADKARKLFGGGKKGDKGKEKKEKEGTKSVSWWKARKKFKTKDSKSHSLYYKGQGKSAELIVASNPQGLQQLIKQRLKQETDPGKKSALNKALELKTALDSYVRKQERNRKKDPNRSTKGLKNEIEKRLSKISFELAKSGLEGGKLPPSNVTYSMMEGRAHLVKANPLTKIPGNTRGSVPRENPKGWDSIRKISDKSEKARWVRLHLLNHNLHGPGKKWNLTPGTKEVNSQMEKEVENKAKAATDKGKILYYEAQVFHHDKPGAHDFPREIDIVWGYLIEKGSGFEKKQKQFKSFYQDLPSKALDQKPLLNEASAAKLSESVEEVSSSIWNDIVTVRRDAPTYRRRAFLRGLVGQKTGASQFINGQDFNALMTEYYLEQGKDKNFFKPYLRKINQAAKDKKIFLFTRY